MVDNRVLIWNWDRVDELVRLAYNRRIEQRSEVGVKWMRKYDQMQHRIIEKV